MTVKEPGILRFYDEARKGRRLIHISKTDFSIAEMRLGTLAKGSHWCGCSIWNNDVMSAMVMMTSIKCKVCFVIFRYDDGSYDLVGNPGMVLARADDLDPLLDLLEDMVVY